MTPAVVQIITALIGATGGIIATFFIKSFNEWRKGKKDEAQKQAEKVQLYKAKAERNRNEYLFLRAWILSQDLTEAQLTRMPKPPPNE